MAPAKKRAKKRSGSSSNFSRGGRRSLLLLSAGLALGIGATLTYQHVDFKSYISKPELPSFFSAERPQPEPAAPAPKHVPPLQQPHAPSAEPNVGTPRAPAESSPAPKPPQNAGSSQEGSGSSEQPQPLTRKKPADNSAAAKPSEQDVIGSYLQSAQQKSPPPRAAGRSNTDAGDSIAALIQGMPNGKQNNTQAAAASESRSQRSAPPAPAQGGTLQAGVFTDPQKAEALRAQLLMEGFEQIVIEADQVNGKAASRVLLGPFKSGAEMEQARRKLRALHLAP